jgi:hypothetical protein
MSKKLFIGLAVFSYVIVAIGVYYAVTDEVPPCGYIYQNVFYNCYNVPAVYRGRCNGKSNCQPGYNCADVPTPCFAPDPQNPVSYPKRETIHLYDLGQCDIDPYSVFYCLVCQSPCRWVCARVWAARDKVVDGQVTPCGDKCRVETYFVGPDGTCY